MDDWWLISLAFLLSAVMRVVQKICSKKVSDEVKGKIFFHYGGYYNLCSAILSLLVLFVAGFDGFDWPTVLCALATAVCMAIELFASIEALKGASLIVTNMFSVGALFIPCIVGIFLFQEPMSIWQWFGLLLFFVSMYFLIAPKKEKNKEKVKKISLKTLLMLILTVLAGGGTMVAQKTFATLVVNGSVAEYSFLMFALNAVILYVCYFGTCCFEKVRTRGVEKSTPKKTSGLSKVLLVCGLILAVAVFVINIIVTELGKTIDSAILFSVSYAIGILVTILVGSLYYKEKITGKNIIGIFLCVGSLAIINFL
ncbi:MAG: hypothetical protein IJB97_08895 [Clostridia bacterium]|nr:hypothetical protein [Clostridia bacterium]